MSYFPFRKYRLEETFCQEKLDIFQEPSVRPGCRTLSNCECQTGAFKLKMANIGWWDCITTARTGKFSLHITMEAVILLTSMYSMFCLLWRHNEAAIVSGCSNVSFTPLGLWNQSSAKGKTLSICGIIISLIYLRTECTRVCSAVKNKLPEFDWSRSMRHWAVVAACSRKSVCFLSRLEACGTPSPSWARSLFNITSLPKTRLLAHWHTLNWTTAMSKMIQGERWIKANIRSQFLQVLLSHSLLQKQCCSFLFLDSNDFHHFNSIHFFRTIQIVRRSGTETLRFPWTSNSGGKRTGLKNRLMWGKEGEKLEIRKAGWTEKKPDRHRMLSWRFGSAGLVSRGKWQHRIKNLCAVA